MKKFWISVFVLSLFIWLTSFASASGCADLYGEHAIDSWGEWCKCKKWYVLNSTETECIKPTKSEWEQACWNDYWYHSTVDEDDYSKCHCKDWYTWNLAETSCEKYTKETWERDCKKSFWYYSVVSEDDYSQCECKEWYEFNSKETRCVKIETASNNTKVEELEEAIQWMYDNWLTIYNTPETFMSDDFLTREQASKFFAQFAAKVLNRQFTEDVDLNKFSDIKKADPSLTYYIIQANHMWLFQWTEWKFMPFNKLTKAQAITVAVRMVDWYLEEVAEARYKNYYDTAKVYWLLKRWDFDLSTLDSENISRWDMALLIYSLYKYINENSDRAGVSWYNDELVDLWDACVNSEDFMDVDEESAEKMTSKELDTISTNALNVCNNSVKQVLEIGGWQWDDTLQRAILLDLWNKISLVKKINELVPYKDLEEFTASQEEEMNKVLGELDELLEQNNKTEEELTKVQTEFAKKHRYQLW